MNRRERRAAVARAKSATDAAPANLAGLLVQARQAHEQGRAAEAEALCRQILERTPADKTALNLLGVVHQAAGRHRLAVKMFAKAIAANDLDPAYHYNIACSYQALGQRTDAAAHFKKAITLGLSKRAPEDFMLRNGVVQACVQRMLGRTLPDNSQDLFGAGEIAAIADDLFIRSALQSTTIRGATLEAFFTQLRAALLRLAAGNILDPGKVENDVLGLFCALAQQCFITEYVFVIGGEEARQAAELRDLLTRQLSAGTAVPPLLLAAVGAYFPLHSLPSAKSLLMGEWRDDAADLVRQQVTEPIEEAEDRGKIPALTAVDDATSMDVMAQYEENPYPRWTVTALAAGAPQADGGNATDAEEDILIAGCGTGQHTFDVAQRSPQAHILAVDLSRASLAYARRKTREAGLRNFDYAQADILQLGGLDRRFDRIESMGVLHHLADPKAGWLVLLSLLKPQGVMRIGLYSETARRTIVEARALIAQRSYRATAEGIRAVRQEIVRKRGDPRWNLLMTTVDFHSMSGCRDMLFNIMEHRFTIAEIAAFLCEQALSFLGFEVEDEFREKFHEQYPDERAFTDLDKWSAFESANSDTFRQMYVFSVRRKEETAGSSPL